MTSIAVRISLLRCSEYETQAMMSSPDSIRNRDRASSPSSSPHLTYSPAVYGRGGWMGGFALRKEVSDSYDRKLLRALACVGGMDGFTLSKS